MGKRKDDSEARAFWTAYHTGDPYPPLSPERERRMLAGYNPPVPTCAHCGHVGRYHVSSRHGFVEHCAECGVVPDPEKKPDGSLSERAWHAMLGVVPKGEKLHVAAPVPLKVPGVSRKVVDGLALPASFRNYEYLRLCSALRYDPAEVAVFKRFRLSLFREVRLRKWPCFFYESKAKSIRVGYFQSSSRTLAPHYGGAVRELTRLEWKVIAASAHEAARRSEITLAWSETDPSLFAMEGEVQARSPEAIRALRSETMQRMTAAFGTKWPENWLDRHNGPDLCPYCDGTKVLRGTGHSGIKPLTCGFCEPGRDL